MIIKNDTKVFVDPVAIARHNTRYRGDLGSRLPLVVRPSLMTDQLRGGGCGCNGGGTLTAYASAARGMDGGAYYLRGLGQAESVDIQGMMTALKTFVSQAKAFWNQLEEALGVGAGRREADVITPIQDKITQTILAPAVQLAANPATRCADIQKMAGVIEYARIEFRNFLINTQWQDGRAADQAMIWLEGPLPASTSGAWFHQVQSDFANDVQRICGVVGGGGSPGGIFQSSGALPLLLGALFVLPKLLGR